jgi:hypothetical protein
MRHAALIRRHAFVAGGPGLVTYASPAEIRRALGFIYPIAGGALVVPDQAEVIGLQYFLNVTAPSNLTLRLGTDNTTPGDTDTEAAGYTEFGATMGYAAVALTPGDWVITPGAPGASPAAYPIVTWTFTAGGPVSAYGYFVTRADGKLMWAERFTPTTPFTVSNNGDKIDVTLNITLA